MTGTPDTQRVDVWLWHARFYKTRSLASKMVRGGKVRINGTICKKSSALVYPDDVLTFTRADEVLIAKIISLGIRRGPAPEARLLYEDLTPTRPAKKDKIQDSIINREKGSGRPTKSDRRAIDKLMNRL
ncbi:MAG: RNA-binding S4 domain-containing protein [Kordiimonadaceae bacterium]|nr:RNA-binding S4 domain-containing protein [Kordiimonadaceae bacterium]